MQERNSGTGEVFRCARVQGCRCGAYVMQEVCRAVVCRVAAGFLQVCRCAGLQEGQGTQEVQVHMCIQYHHFNKCYNHGYYGGIMSALLL